MNKVEFRVLGWNLNWTSTLVLTSALVLTLTSTFRFVYAFSTSEFFSFEIVSPYDDLSISFEIVSLSDNLSIYVVSSLCNCSLLISFEIASQSSYFCCFLYL